MFRYDTISIVVSSLTKLKKVMDPHQDTDPRSKIRLLVHKEKKDFLMFLLDFHRVIFKY